MYKHFFFLKLGRGKIETLKSWNNYSKEIILFLLTVTERDTTSTFLNKIKIKVLKLFEKHPDLQSSAAVFKTEN